VLCDSGEAFAPKTPWWLYPRESALGTMRSIGGLVAVGMREVVA
jgi:hypothetical protein